MRHAHRFGPWALITGASDGIGKALAGQIAADGINVVLCSRSQDELAALAAELTADHGIETLVLPADLADPGGVDTVADRTGRFDMGLVVLAAGFGTTGSVLETSLTDELEMIAVKHHRGHASFAHLRRPSRGAGQRWSGAVRINCRSARCAGTSQLRGVQGVCAELGRGLHDELALCGVDVLAVAPGPIVSGFGARAGLTMTSATTPDVVATATLDALGRRTVIPGARGEFLTATLTPLPRRVRSLILGKVIAGMRTQPSQACMECTL